MFLTDPAESLDRQVKALPMAPALALAERCDGLRAAGREVFRLGLGQSPFPVPGPIVEALVEHAAVKDYVDPTGLPALREAIAGYTSRRAAADYRPEDVLVAPGSKELMFLFQLSLNAELVVPTPSWVSCEHQARVAGRKVLRVPARKEHAFRMDAEELRAALGEPSRRPRVLILNYPSNPTGGSYKADELASIAQVAADHGLLVVSDEIYAELHHKGEHVSLAQFYPEGTIISSGLSKWCGAGGWRLGTFIFPSELARLRAAITALASETYTSTSAPIQHAAVAAFRGGEAVEGYLAHARRVLSALGRWCARRLRASGMGCPQPVGAFYLFVDFSAASKGFAAADVQTSAQLCRRLLEDTGVALLPGSAFGRPDRELTARLAYVDFDGRRALDAVRVIPREQPLDLIFFRRHCEGVTTAIERLCEWYEAKARGSE